MTTTTEDLQLLRADEAAELLGVSLETVRIWMKARRLPVTKIGPRAVRIPRSGLQRAISANTTAAVA